MVARFVPELDRPSERKAKSIIKAIIKAKNVVVVPGYNNLYDFIADGHYHIIVDQLNKWQVKDSLKFGWLKGMTGHTKDTPKKVRKLMDSLYYKVKVQKRVVYQMLQIQGVEAHAWLVVDMYKTSDGYKIHVVDSNFGQVVSFRYKNGMTNFIYPGDNGKFLPYTQFEKEETKLYKAVKNYCK